MTDNDLIALYHALIDAGVDVELQESRWGPDTQLEVRYLSGVMATVHGPMNPSGFLWVRSDGDGVHRAATVADAVKQLSTDTEQNDKEN